VGAAALEGGLRSCCSCGWAELCQHLLYRAHLDHTWGSLHLSSLLCLPPLHAPDLLAEASAERRGCGVAAAPAEGCPRSPEPGCQLPGVRWPDVIASVGEGLLQDHWVQVAANGQEGKLFIALFTLNIKPLTLKPYPASPGIQKHGCDCRDGLLQDHLGPSRGAWTRGQDSKTLTPQTVHPYPAWAWATVLFLPRPTSCHSPSLLFSSEPRPFQSHTGCALFVPTPPPAALPSPAVGQS